MAEKIGSAYIEIGARRASGQPKRTINALRAALKKEGDIDVPVDIDDVDLAEDLRDAIKNAEKAADEIEVPVGVDTLLAKARLAKLTRPRVVTIFAQLNHASVLNVAKSLAMLSGARLISTYFDNLFNSIKRLDKSLPSIAGLSSAIGGLSAAATSALGSIFSVGAGLAQVAGAALLLPAILGGVVVGIGGLVMAFSDTSKVLGDLGPKFADLQDKLSASFWKKAEEPIRNLADKVLPILGKRFEETGDALGGMVGHISDVIGRAKNLDMLDTMFGNINKSIDIAKSGMGDFTQALLTLSGEGSKYLPRMAEWFNQLGADFDNWISEAAADGRLHEWIENGITALKDLGSIIGSTAGILSAFSDAALAAGGPTLGNLADGLEKVNEALNGPLWQGALTDVFRGANQGMSEMGQGVSALGDAFLNISDTIEDVLGKAGEAASGFMELIAEVIQQPAFTEGLKGFFDGIIAGIDGVKEGADGFAEVFGGMMQFAGDLAAVIGPVLGAAFDEFGPILQDVLAALTPVAEVLGGWLYDVIKAIGPPIATVVSAISDWVQENPELTAVLGLLAGAVGVVVAGLAGLVTWLAPIVATVAPIVNSLAGMAGGWSAVGGAIAGVLGPVAAVVGIIAAVAAAVTYAWNTSQEFRDAVMGLGQGIMDFFAPIVEFITGTVVPTLAEIGGAIMGALTTIGDALTPLLTVVVQIITEVFNQLTPVVEFLIGILGPAFTFLGDVISNVFTFIGDVIGAAIDVITAVLETFLALITGDWQGVWEGLGAIVQTAWDLIITIIGGAIELIFNTLVGLGVMVGEIFATMWSVVSGWVMNLATTVGTWFMTMYTTVVTWVTNLVTSIGTWFSNLYTTVVNWVMNLVTSIGTWFANLYTTVSTWVSNLVSTVINWFANLGSRAASTISSMVSAVVTWFTNLYTRVSTTISNMVSAVVNWFVNLKNQAVNKAQSLVSSAVSKFNDLKSRVTSTIQTLVSAAVDRFNQLKSRIGNAVETAKSLAVNAFNAIRNGIGNAMSAVASVVSTGVSKVVNFFTDMGSRAVSTISNFIGNLRSVGADMISGLIGGIKSMAGRVVSAAKDVVSGAIDAAKDFLGINSPSKVFMELGQFTGEGYSKGLENMMKPVEDATNKMISLPNKMGGIDMGLNSSTNGLKLPSSRDTAPAGTAGAAPGGMNVNGPLVALNGPVTLDSDDRVRQLAENLWTRAHRTDRAQGKVNLGGVVRS